MWIKSVYVSLKQIKQGNLTVHWVVCHLSLVTPPLWCHFITFTWSLFNQLSQSARPLWSKYKAIKLILESDPIQVDPFLTLLYDPKQQGFENGDLKTTGEGQRYYFKDYIERSLPVKSVGYRRSSFMINEALF